MRVTNSMMFRQSLETMNQRQAQVVKLQNELSSGQKLNHAKDDPVAMGRVMRNDDIVTRLDRHLETIGRLDDRLGQTDATLASATDLLHRGRELLVAASNDTLSDVDRESLAIEMRGLADGLLDAANTTDGQGRYLFGGQLDQQPPFVETGGAVSYQGGAQARQVPVADNVQVRDGQVGSEVFLNGPAGDMFAMLDDLADVMATPTPDATSAAARQTAMANGLDQFDDALDHVLNTRAQLGADMRRMDSLRESAEALQLELRSASSDLRDTDYAESAANLSLELTSLEAARRTFTSVQNLSLFDFL